MLALVTTIVLGLCVSSPIAANLSPHGNKCGQKLCKSTEYCSQFDTQCKPCSLICDPSDHNHQPEDCIRDCQEYLHDQRYALRAELGQYEELKGEVERLRTLLTVTLTLTCLAIMAIVYLLIKAFVRWNKIGKVIRDVFSKKWVKKRTFQKATNNNKVQDDVEAAATNAKQNGLKLSMPTISATVASTTDTTNGNGNGTPNTTSTPLSRRHPSEDTTLDYAYDNPAMTPSPEAAQLRTKRESSF